MMATPQKHKCHDMNASETSVPSCLFFLRAMQDITNDCVSCPQAFDIHMDPPHPSSKTVTRNEASALCHP